MLSDSCSGLYLNLYLPSYKWKVEYLSCPGGVLKMYFEYQSLEVEKLKFNLDNKF